jgi:hypothetical protein
MSAIPITISGFKPLQGLSGSAFGQFLSRLAGKLRKGQRKGERHRKALTSFTSPEQGLSSIGRAAATCDIAPSQSNGLRLSHWAIRLVLFADLSLKFQVVERHFESLDEVLIWVDRNQLGRRNLTDEQRAVVMGRLYKTVKQNPLLNLKQFQTDNSDRVLNLSTRRGSAATARAVAEQLGVGQATVRRAEKFADTVEELQQISPQAAERVLRGEVRDALTELPKVPKEALSFVAEKIEEGKRVIKEILREWRYQQLEAPPLPKEKFDVIYIVFQSHNSSIAT